MDDSTAEPKAGRLGEIAAYFLRLGSLGFGGPVALVGQMERELVAERGWLSREEMREAVALCQTMPGPLAIQVGIYIAWLRGGQLGAWLGGWCFILPNFLIVVGLAALYVAFDGLPWMTAVFYGVSPAVIALILHSTWRLAKLEELPVYAGHASKVTALVTRDKRVMRLPLALPKAGTTVRLALRDVAVVGKWLGG